MEMVKLSHGWLTVYITGFDNESARYDGNAMYLVHIAYEGKFGILGIPYCYLLQIKSNKHALLLSLKLW
jgi:hypothetical protein